MTMKTYLSNAESTRFSTTQRIRVTSPLLLLFSVCHVWLFVTPGTVAYQAPLSTISRSLLKCMSIESVMLSNCLILCCPLLLLPSIFPSIRVFSNESALRIQWPKYWSFSFNISPSNEHPGPICTWKKWRGSLCGTGSWYLPTCAPSQCSSSSISWPLLYQSCD